jgi:hypothetical protein
MVVICPLDLLVPDSLGICPPGGFLIKAEHPAFTVAVAALSASSGFLSVVYLIKGIPPDYQPEPLAHNKPE